MKYLGYGSTSTIFRGALCLCYRLKTNKLKSDIHVNMPQKRKFSLSLGRKHNRTIKRSAHDLKAIVVIHYPLYVVCNPSMCKRLCILCPGSNYRGHIVFVFSVCQPVDLIFNLRYNFWTLGDFIFGLHTPLRLYLQIKQRVDDFMTLGATVAEWLSSWLAKQEVRGSIPGLATWISEIGYLLLPSRDMAEIPLKWRKSSI